jgi:hypothetical protein
LSAFLLEVCQFQVTTSFSKVVKCAVIFFPQNVARPPHSQHTHTHTHTRTSALDSHNIQPHPPPSKVETFPSFIWPPILFRRGATCLPVVLDYVIPSRVEDVLQPPGRVTDSLGLVKIGSAPGWFRQTTV